MNHLSDNMTVEARLFDPSGRLRAEGTYRNRIKEGTWSFYSEKSLPMFHIPYTQGKVNGEALRYDINGTLVERTQWQDNVLNGLQVIYYPGDRPQAKIRYRNGEIDGLYELFFSDGSPEVTGTYTKGLKTGTWHYYRSGGTPDYSLEYSKGKLLNPEILDQRQRESFERYEKNRLLLKDPQDFINNPDELMIR
jgi:antitoxin component YwqK of YwqJK toxin-antitoxin module